MQISAIVSTYNRAEFLKGLFDSVLAQTVSLGQIELIIVNNNSTDKTAEICHDFIGKHPELRTVYCEETRQGLSYGRNRGIEESNYELITFLDDDAVPAPDFMEKTISFFEIHPLVNAIGGKILLRYMGEPPDWYNPFLASLLGYFNPGDRERSFRHNYFRGSNMSFRKTLFTKYKPFNPLLGRVGRDLYGNEEKELFYRLKEAGEPMWYVPSAVVYHLVPPARTETDFVRKQALGTGSSQRKQARVKGTSQEWIAVFKELLKWGITLGLSVIYLLVFKPAVAFMLIRFRFWVSKGMLDK